MWRKLLQAGTVANLLTMMVLWVSGMCGMCVFLNIRRYFWALMTVTLIGIMMQYTDGIVNLHLLVVVTLLCSYDHVRVVSCDVWWVIWAFMYGINYWTEWWWCVMMVSMPVTFNYLVLAIVNWRRWHGKRWKHWATEIIVNEQVL
jgi:hypothetical protein